VPTATADPAAADYELGYRDALNKQAYRDRDRSNQAYGDGFKAGEVRQKAIAASGPDYETGYRDGFNQQPLRDRDRNNRRYSDGYRAGQAQQAIVARGPVVAAAPALTRADYDNGFRDGFNKAEYRDRDRNNQSYAEGYKAGQARSQALAAGGRDYEQGFRDGFNRQAYSERDRGNRAYADGYAAGQREAATARLLPPIGRAPTSAAVAPPSNVDGLVGRPESMLDSDMKSLGFERWGQFKKGKEAFTTWRSRAQNRCVRITAREGKVKELIDLGSDRCQ
jgi:hypothetical protein